MINLKKIYSLAESYKVPVEDVLFVALNIYGVAFKCDFNRMRMGVHTIDQDVFKYSHSLGINDFYFALPINESSPFSVIDGKLLFDNQEIANAIDPSEDFCDSNYSRRNGTVLNINPNSRTSCRGCKFCYTGYQVPRDMKRMACSADIKEFFDNWMDEKRLLDLSNLVQVAVVTGCYNSNDDLSAFLILLREMLDRYQFKGEIFYLGSQIVNKETIKKLESIQPFCYCISLECFENRNTLLRDKKGSMTIESAFKLMEFANSVGHRVNFSYVLGLESLFTVEKYFLLARRFINSFPIVNTIQLHKYHSTSLLTPEAVNIEYFFKARKLFERIFINTDMRPREWENYRSLWFLKFAEEELTGIRTP
ncbi:MAG: hypothetical protein EOM84_00575 [Sphingobacteriia bacterium]|jgi:hypothetical protein|nr:hypothetical protein [Sphingobacteriia bacterium]